MIVTIGVMGILGHCTGRAELSVNMQFNSAFVVLSKFELNFSLFLL